MKTFGLEEAAEFLRVSNDSMRDMADSGKVPAAKIGPTTGYRWVFTDESLEDYLREEIRRQTAARRPESSTNQPVEFVPRRRKTRQPPALKRT